jgi:hypothetical protein
LASLSISNSALAFLKQRSAPKGSHQFVTPASSDIRNVRASDLHVTTVNSGVFSASSTRSLALLFAKRWQQNPAAPLGAFRDPQPIVSHSLRATPHIFSPQLSTFNIAAFLPSDLHLVIFPAPKHSKNYASGLLLSNVAVRLSNS